MCAAQHTCFEKVCQKLKLLRFTHSVEYLCNLKLQNIAFAQAHCVLCLGLYVAILAVGLFQSSRMLLTSAVWCLHGSLDL